MNRLLRAMVMVSVLLPQAAAAQGYADRVLTIKKTVRDSLPVARYQGRNRDNSHEETERSTKTLKLGADAALGIGNIAGDIVITRASGSDTTIEIVKTARGRDAADAREMLQLVQVDVSERANRADVRTRYPGDEARGNNRRNVNVSVSYNVSAPVGLRISAESIAGSIKVTDIKGDVSASSVSGDVRIAGAGRVSSAKSISGTVEVADAQDDGALEPSSVSGDVILRRVNARRIDAGSVSGNIKLDDLQCERVSAKTISGSVTFSGALARNGRYELQSFSGDVRLQLSGNAGFEIEAHSSSGEVRSDFEIVTRGTQETRRGRRRVLSGTFGDGSAVLDLTTFSGSIVLTRK